MKIYNTSQTNLIADDVKVAKTFLTRSVGLLSKTSVLENEGLVIKPCCSVHTFFMKFNIDVLFVNKQNKIIALYKNVPKNKILPIHLNSNYVIELSADSISKKNIKKGDTVKIEE